MPQQGMQTAAEKRDEQHQALATQKFADVRSLLGKMEGQIANALPRHMTAARMIRVATTAISKTPALLDCDQRSLIGSIVQAAELGLEPNTPLGHAYLIPYRNHKNGNRYEAQLQIGYRGYIALARRSGEISSISAEIVFKNDVFEVSYGTDRRLTHVPALNQDRGEKLGAYAVVVFKDGFHDFEYMDSVQIEAIRKQSKASDNGPWKTHPEEMWRKTPIRRLCKRLPLATEDQSLIKAAVIDEYGDAGLSTHDVTFLPSGSANGSSVEIPAEPPPPVISEEQRQALAVFVANGLDPQILTDVVHSFGFNMLADITIDKYTEVYNELTRRAAQAAVPVVIDVAIIEPPVEVPQAQAPEQEQEPPQVDKAESERIDFETASFECYRDLDANQKMEADKFLGAKGIKDLTTPKLKEFLKKFGAAS